MQWYRASCRFNMALIHWNVSFGNYRYGATHQWSWLGSFLTKKHTNHDSWYNYFKWHDAWTVRITSHSYHQKQGFIGQCTLHLLLGALIRTSQGIQIVVTISREGHHINLLACWSIMTNPLVLYYIHALSFFVLRLKIIFEEKEISGLPNQHESYVTGAWLWTTSTMHYY